MQILLVEPYDTGSHARWMRGYQAHSRHKIEILSLEGQFWQWRLLGGAVTLAERFLQQDQVPDLLLASSMLDLTTFLALTRASTATMPVAIYFHENQLNYPHGPRQKLANHYAFINYISVLAADAVFFNSMFHRDAFLDELPRLLKHFPDHNNLHTIDQLRQRSQVLPVGLALSDYDEYAPSAKPDKLPLILWNHRWEFDKNPALFLDVVCQLADEGYDFRVAITGENFRQDPREFRIARQKLGARLVQFGFLETRADYVRLLWEADVVVSTAIQDFFGISVVEAIYCGCWPVLPRRLNYPALVPDDWHAQALFTADGGLYHILRDHITHPRPTPLAFRQHVSAFDWVVLAPLYDRVFERLI